MRPSAMARFGSHGMALLLLVVCSSVSLSSTSAANALPSDVVEDLQRWNQEAQSFSRGRQRHRSLLQAVSPTSPPALAPAASPPALVPVLAPAPRLAPTPTPTPATVIPPAPAPVAPRAPPTPVRTYLMYTGIAALCLVFLSVAVFCLCRKFGDRKIRGAQRLPPLPRYH